MTHWQEPAKLDACSFIHDYSSGSRISLSTPPPSLETLAATHQQTNSLKAKFPEEIALTYHRLLVTKGKWNADAYLKTLSALKAKQAVTLPHLLFQSETPTLRHDKVLKRQNAVNTKYESITVDCEVRKAPAKISENPVPRLISPPPEPSYKKIFKNAKLKGKPMEDQFACDILPSSPPSHRETGTTDQTPIVAIAEVVEKPCELMKDSINNYLLDVRTAMAEKVKNKKVSFGSLPEENLDNIEKHYQNRTMQSILEDNLEEQIQLMNVSLKSNLAELSGSNLLRDVGFNELKSCCLNDGNSIKEFQDLFEDSRWRKKFDLDRIEASDEDDSLDVSEIESSDSASVCSRDSLESELDYKSRPPFPSRIPYIDEVRKLGEVLFDKISLKLERAVKKNFLDHDVKPYFRQFSNEIRLRSSYPVYSDVMKLLEPYDKVYTKKFTPFKYRRLHEQEKHKEMIHEKHIVRKKRYIIESRQTPNIASGKQKHHQQSEHQCPTKFSSKNQRYRLKCIMRETERRGEESSAYTYSKKTVAEDCANLKPIVRTRNQLQLASVALEQPSYKSAPSTGLSKPDNSMRPLLVEATSTFYQPQTVPAFSPSKLRGLKSASRLTTKSRPRVRLPI